MKNYLFVLLFQFGLLITYSQSNKNFNLTPYIGLNSPTRGLKDFSNDGFVSGLALDYYFGKKIGFGLDFNYQSNPFKSSYDFSVISSPFTVLETQKGNWSTSTLTFGPTYKIGSKKLSAEIYSKAGVSYTKSPNYDAVLSSSSISKSILTLPEQERTSFGLTSGIRFNYNISDKLSLFLNPQYVYSASKVEYCNCGLDNLDNPNLIINQDPIKETISPSFINLNAGVKWSLGGNTDINNNEEENSSVNRNIPICDITFDNLECTDTDPLLQLTMFWSNFDALFTRTVEIFSGNNLINPSSSAPQVLSQNYGNIPFYSPILASLIGTNLSASIKIYNTNGILVCDKTINFTVPQCTPPPPSCSFVLDFNNVTCDSNFITYSASGTWSNINVGSIIELEAKTLSGTIIPINVTPSNNAQISIAPSNINGNFTWSISIPYSYNGTQLNIVMKIKEPTTGYEMNCGFTDLFVPQCTPSMTACDWVNKITCDSTTKGIKININSNWTNVPVGCTLSYTLIDTNGGGTIPFVISPNNLPMSITPNGNALQNLFLGSNYSGSNLILKMEISDSNGALFCNKVANIILPNCVFKTCQPKLISAICTNEMPYIDFNVPWTNFNNYTNYNIVVELFSNNSQITSITFPPYSLTGINGLANFNAYLPQQYAGSTIEVRSSICENGGIKNCCRESLIIDVPKCCEVCSDVTVIDTTDKNQNNLNDFVITGTITRPISSASPITKIVTQLESISFNRIGSNNVTVQNSEFRKGWFNYAGSTSGINSNFIGSITGTRSNIIINNINQANAVPITFRLFVDNYNNGSNLRVMYYKVKLTLYKTDGTYCEKVIDYTR